VTGADDEDSDNVVEAGDRFGRSFGEEGRSKGLGKGRKRERKSRAEGSDIGF
jgi:hypothetical protein